MHDIIVIGGGPAGSTAATLLARRGHSVLLLEREHFPREHIGESLLPASLPVLEDLGVMEAVRAEGFTVKHGATMVWGNDRTPWSWYFRETNRTNPTSFQVWRPRFDQILLENAKAHGVDVREGHRVLGIDPLEHLGQVRPPEELSVPFVDDAGAELTATGRFIVDASGQSGLIGRALGLRKPDEHFQNLAAYAYFAGCERLPEPDQGNIFIESYEHGWFWMIPLSNGLMSVGAVCDHRHGSEGIRELGLEGYLRAQIAAAPSASRMLRNATMEQGPFVIRDWSYASDEVVGERWILAGDAACFIDPLFSTGVHLALSSGVLASAYIETALKDRELAIAAAPVYKDLYYGQYNLFRSMARLFYSTNRTVDSYFWEARRILGPEAELSPRSAFIRAVAGQPPRGYERAVLEHGEIPPGLVEGVQAISAERSGRQAAFDLLAAKAGPGSLFEAHPVAHPSVKVEKRPVLGEGEFAWGYVFTHDGRPEGQEINAFVGTLLGLCDGSRTVQALVPELAARFGATAATITGPVLGALKLLYTDGAIATLR